MKKIIFILCLLLIASPVFADTFMANMTRHNQAISPCSYSSATPFTIGDANRTVTCTPTSGLACALTTNDAAKCTIVSGAVHAVGAGACTVYCNQAGNVHWFAAAQASQGITVSAGCTASDSDTTASTPANAAAGTKYAIRWLTPAWGADKVIKKIDVQLYKGAGTCDGTATVTIRVNNGGAPGAVATNGTATNPITNSGLLLGTLAWISATPGALADFGAGVTMSQSTVYWLTIENSDSVCNVYYEYDSAGGGSNTAYYYDTSWHVQLDNTRPTFRAYDCTPNVSLTTDFDGLTVPYGKAQDIGAYEWQPVPPHYNPPARR